MSWTSLYLPLTRGLDLSKELVLGGEELHLATNVDFGPDGSIKGRPSRGTPADVIVRKASTSWDVAPSYDTAAAFNTTGFTPLGMTRVRDASGERPALCTAGRLFLKGDDYWVDQGHFACTRVDRLIDFPYHFVITDPSTSRETVAPDFTRVRVGSNYSIWGLLSDDGAIEREVVDAATLKYAYPGTATRCGTTTAAVVIDNANKLNMYYRTAGGTSLTLVQLATDARNPSDTGDAPCICPRADGLGFMVAYRTTTANVLKVLKVGLTGTVAATYTSGAIAGLTGLWVDNTAGNVALAFTSSASGMTIRQLNPTTMATTGSDATDASGTGAWVVCGSESSAKTWYACAGTNVYVGSVALGTSTLTQHKVYYTASGGGPAVILTACHQPVKVGGRMYLTLCASYSWSSTINAGSWLTLDLTNYFTTATTATGPLKYPTIAARGPANGTYPHLQPSPAVPLSDDTGFTFATQDWQELALADTSVTTSSVVYGITAANGLNRVQVSGPRSAQLGETTVFSGSVPHMVARGDCVELGFPFLGGYPRLSVSPDVGAMAAGSYSLQACWRWTDEAGQVHRSAPSGVATITLGSPGSINALVSNLQMTEKASRVAIEVYCTPVNPSADSAHYLKATATVFDNSPYTTIAITSAPLTSELTLYTDGDVLANYPVSADGGVVAVGRRLWMAGANQAYASKLWTPTVGPEFNDDAPQDQPSLAVNLPAGAGRIVALEALDDKVVVFCERGVYLIQDGGPSNTGTGSDFAPALRVSDLRIAGPRSACQTDQGILFCSPLDTTDPSRGGLWMVDRQFTFTNRQYMSRPVQAYLADSTWIPELAYSPERQQAYITTPNANGTSDGVLVMDLRLEKWAVWDTRSGTTGALRNIAVVEGALWVLNNEPAPFNGTPGTDADSVGDYPMTIATSDLASNGRDGLGWSRVRSVSVLPAEGASSHTLTLGATFDRTRTASSSGSIVQTTGTGTTWPSHRLAPEWRLPTQKCSTIQVQASATPAVARWAAIRLDVAPLPRRAPARTRS